MKHWLAEPMRRQILIVRSLRMQNSLPFIHIYSLPLSLFLSFSGNRKLCIIIFIMILWLLPCAIATMIVIDLTHKTKKEKNKRAAARSNGMRTNRLWCSLDDKDLLNELTDNNHPLVDDKCVGRPNDHLMQTKSLIIDAASIVWWALGTGGF